METSIVNITVMLLEALFTSGESRTSTGVDDNPIQK